MRYLAVIVALVVSGCIELKEYVLPGGAGGDTGSSGDTMAATGDAPTGGDTSKGSGDTGSGDSEGECAGQQTRCGEQCVDLLREEAHCGECDGGCKSDEMCVVGECRDVIVLECTSCPCADQCPGTGEGVLEATSGDGSSESDHAEDGGDSGDQDPQQGLCCEVAEPMQVLCIRGDLGDTLVCPT